MFIPTYLILGDDDTVEGRGALVQGLRKDAGLAVREEHSAAAVSAGIHLLGRRGGTLHLLGRRWGRLGPLGSRGRRRGGDLKDATQVWPVVGGVDTEGVQNLQTKASLSKDRANGSM